MARPTDDKKDKNPNKKLELSPGNMMFINNLVILVAIVVCLAIMYILLDSSINKKIAKLIPQDEQENYEDDEEETRQEGVLLDLGEFVLNLADVSSRRYLKVGIAIELSKTRDEIASMQQDSKSGGHGHSESSLPDQSSSIIAEMERYKPAIRDAIISILSNKTSDELSSPTGKEVAKEEILETINSIFEGKREVMRVSFGQFIIQ